MNATQPVWTVTQIQERVETCRTFAHGAAARLGELLVADPAADVSEQIQLIRNCSLAFREALEAQQRFPDPMAAMLPEIYDEGVTIEWSPEFHPL